MEVADLIRVKNVYIKPLEGSYFIDLQAYQVALPIILRVWLKFRCLHCTLVFLFLLLYKGEAWRRNSLLQHFRLLRGSETQPDCPFVLTSWRVNKTRSWITAKLRYRIPNKRFSPMNQRWRQLSTAQVNSLVLHTRQHLDFKNHSVGFL